MSAKKNQKHNVIFFMMDQLSAKWLEAAGDGICPIPNIKRLQAMGTTFTQAYTSNPVCCPARATLATGLTSRQHGVLRNGMGLDHRYPTYMRELRNAGWATGAFGKVHLPQPKHVHPGGAYDSVSSDYRCYGFDTTHITEDHRRGEWIEWVEKEHPEYYQAALTTAWPCEVGNDDSLFPAIKKALENWETAKMTKYPDGMPPDDSLPFPEQVSQTSWITKKACRYIEAAPESKPLFMHISYVEPHSPFRPPQQYMSLVDPKRIPDVIHPTWPQDPHHPRHFDQSVAVMPDVPENWLDRRTHYFADIAHLDEKLGKILDALEQAGRLENSFIFLLADHGEMLFDHGCEEKEGKHYDACIRVPLIISGPELKRGATVDTYVQLEDICPTVLDAVQLPYPNPEGLIPPKSLPGFSLLPWCRGETPDNARSYAYIESYSRTEPGEEHALSSDPRHWARTIRTKCHRYTYCPCDGGEQLFDLAADPDEVRNLVDSADYQDIRHTMRQQLLDAIILQDFPTLNRL